MFLDNFYGLVAIMIYCLLVLVFCYGQRTKQWKWSEYFMMVGAVLLGLVFLILAQGLMALAYFLFCAVVGFLCEYLIGFLFHKTMGQKLWVYHKGAVGGYTSLLAIPFWGMAGIIFLAIAKLLNL